MDPKEIQQAKFKELDDYIAAIPTIKKFNIKASKESATAMTGTNLCKADCLEVSDVPSPTYEDLRYIHERLNSFREDYWRLWEALNEHERNGHLPRIQGAGAMNKALKALGLGDDYKVEPKVIYANDGSASAYQWTIPASAFKS